MRSDYKDITGEVFGYLTAKRIASSKPVRWLCECDCGNLIIVKGNSLRSGHTRSCGCSTGKLIAERQTTHGMAKSDEYRIYQGVKTRCYDKNHASYKDYGARGIDICKRWLGESGFENFFADMGKRPSSEYSIERKCNDTGYSKENCKWATRYEQNRNNRRNNNIEFNGIIKCITDWSEHIGITQSALQDRLNRMPVEIALSMPANPDRKKYVKANGKSLTLNEWAKELGISKSQVQRRLKVMMPDEALREIKRSSVNTKKVQQLTKDGEAIAEFKSISEAGRQVGIDFRLISAVLNGKQKTTGGYRWEYAKC